jgi:hypothetical protein
VDLPWPSRFILEVARFMLEAAQHALTISSIASHLMSTLLQTLLKRWHGRPKKTSSLQNGTRKPSPLIAPQWCFSACPEPWWETVAAMFKKISAHPSLSSMDYLIPTVSRGSHGVIPRPSSYSRLLRWLKEALYSVAPTEEIGKITSYSIALNESLHAGLCTSSADPEGPTPISRQLGLHRSC